MIRSLGLLLLLLLFPAGTAFPAETKLEDLFAGKVERYKARRLTVTYDFSDAAQLEDFDVVNPFLRPRAGGFTVKDGKLRAKGVGALRHKCVFEADLEVAFTLSAKRAEDVGAVLLQPGLTDRFLLFSLADTFFSERDRQTPKQHMITVVGAEGEGTDRDSAFRYLKRSLEPKVPSDKAHDLVVRKLGDRNRFTFAGNYMEATDRYGKFPDVQPALFVLGSEMVVTSLTISGRLTMAWLDENGIGYDPDEPDPKAREEMERPKSGLKPVPESSRGGGRRGGGGSRRGGGSEASEFVRSFSDTSLSEEDREAAASKLTKKNVKYDEMKQLRDSLYSDDLMTRTLAIKVLKRVTGKTMGYHPKAPEDARKKAIRKWYRYILQNRERFE